MNGGMNPLYILLESGHFVVFMAYTPVYLHVKNAG
jgi:hypothetical protein